MRRHSIILATIAILLGASPALARAASPDEIYGGLASLVLAALFALAAVLIVKSRWPQLWAQWSIRTPLGTRNLLGQVVALLTFLPLVLLCRRLFG